MGGVPTLQISFKYTRSAAKAEPNTSGSRARRNPSAETFARLIHDNDRTHTNTHQHTQKRTADRRFRQHSSFVLPTFLSSWRFLRRSDSPRLRGFAFSFFFFSFWVRLPLLTFPFFFFFPAPFSSPAHCIQDCSIFPFVYEQLPKNKKKERERCGRYLFQISFSRRVSVELALSSCLVCFGERGKERGGREPRWGLLRLLAVLCLCVFRFSRILVSILFLSLSLSRYISFRFVHRIEIDGTERRARILLTLASKPCVHVFVLVRVEGK